MKAGAVVGATVTVAAGLAVIIFLRTADSGKPAVGVKKAQAAKCTASDYHCLPDVDFVDVDGQVFGKKAYEGKVVMVNFWATWCAPCKKEVPALSAAFQKYKDKGFVLYGVMTDTPDLDTLERFSTTYKLDYPVIQADYPIMEAWQYPPNLPTTFIYDRKGKLRLERKGALNEADLDRIIPELLAE